MIRALLRAIRLGFALARLEAAERAGAAICLHSSWCAEPGSGFWIALVRPGEWAEVPLGRSVVGRDLLVVMQRAAECTRGCRGKRPAPLPSSAPVRLESEAENEGPTS